MDSFKTAKTAVYAMENTGSWETNCALKPLVIQKALEDYDDHLMFVDIDGRLQNPLVPIEFPETVGLFYWNRNWDNVRELMSGTIYIPNNDEGKNLVDLWVKYQLANLKVWDQKVLQHVVEKNDINYAQLPDIWMSVDGHIHNPEGIIHHEQASRRHKHNITGRILQ